ncbi:MAG: hypothetical protein ACFFCS_20755 [Candidatus Hodarchaeota archaeon]
MSDIEKIKDKCLDVLKDFKGAIEIDDFHRFLLLTFSSHTSGPMGMMGMLGLGPGTTSLTLSYDPMRKLYFFKVLGGNQEQSQIFLYSKRDAITDDFFSNEPATLLKDYLSTKEIELLGIGTKKKKLMHVEATDFQLLGTMADTSGKKLKLDIDLVFSDLKAFIAGYDEKSRVFLMEAEDGDVLFSVNFSPLLKKDDVNLITFDVYLDEKKEIRDYTYICMDQKANLSFSNEVKEKGIQNTLYCLIVPVKSFEIP